MTKSDALTIYVYRRLNGWESDIWRGDEELCGCTAPSLGSLMDLTHEIILDSDPTWADFNANDDLMTHDDDDISPEEYKSLAKYFKRTGIFRMYKILRPPSGGTQVMLEFVVRGKVICSINLWKRKRSIFRGNDEQ